MNSVILQIASKYVRWLLIIFALIALLRGHNHPGGGFIGGLLAGLSVVFISFAYTKEQVVEQLKVKPIGYIGTGLGLILISFLPSAFLQKELMTGLWITLPLPLLGELKLGTPLLFDIGVFAAVIGVTQLFLFTLKERSQWK
jgi:multicomponent Na+:H+ antiporter subunit B